jgi:thymidylate kinase
MVVLEGLDRSGKSTQMRRLQRLPWLEPAPMFIHMPSGVASLTQSIYRLTETETDLLAPGPAAAAPGVPR